MTIDMPARRLAPRRVAMLVVTQILALGCSPGLDDDPPSVAIIEPDCTRTGDLIVELGEGADRFEPIPVDGRPTLHYGSQGGTHLILAARLTTPDPLDRYEITLLAEAGQQPCVDESCSSFSPIGRFEGVIEGSTRIQQVSANEVEITSLFLLVDNWLAAPVARLTLELRDACARETEVVGNFASEP